MARPSPCLAFSLLPLIALLCSALLSCPRPAGARPTTTFAPAPAPAPASLLQARRLDGAREPPEQQYCWDALVEMKSCTGEIILFVLNGEAYLGPGCCRAVRTIERRCWAADAVMSVIGFTPEEGDMLKGYCDEAGGGNDAGGAGPGQGRKLGSSWSSRLPDHRRGAGAYDTAERAVAPCP